ncbi:hypothetical protein RBSWK_05460 [Rhodopirellula baltica SWK14]|uniref:Uncharacterized protein n=1 Tax=Rhodopirellula baltica SWK14 TaxID=993516 RepID=L7C8W1_RHOBT|nr:hypothetical protein RBSWK_05460 [Rhodopirellula baltica SWK14]
MGLVNGRPMTGSRGPWTARNASLPFKHCTRSPVATWPTDSTLPRKFPNANRKSFASLNISRMALATVLALNISRMALATVFALNISRMALAQ